ncbi:sensor histidine kinase [Paenibacillus sp. CF384]|uniref:sensor histidine kinase n=1 Tax=Paenibacillus sp. CF384 TaxID=1884382 RepID=UPI00089524B7|nr:ATP-binding protein [Paenibacillus sp. CF384]SDW68645.1 two-component system, NarL family, sensor histidine kinase ComP [Paenibacillus sp. CF384]
MRNNFMIKLCVFTFVMLQLWCSFITFTKPYLGINLAYTPEQQWVISKLDLEGVSSQLDVSVGDIIIEVDGMNPNDYHTVKAWHVIEQAHQILLSRAGQEHIVQVEMATLSAFTIIPFLVEMLCQFMALFLFVKMRHSLSARLLLLFFLTTAIIFMSLGASIRGDAVGKLLIVSFIAILPVVFYHFSCVFFREKGEIRLRTGFIKALYAIAALATVVRLYVYFFNTPFAYTMLQLESPVTLLLFIIGFLFNMYILTALYFKFRKQQSPASTIVKTAWWSMLISFTPVISLTFLPQVLTGSRLLDGIYTSWAILLFPITLAYLLMSDQVHDIALVLRRFVCTGLIATLPVTLFTAIYMLFFHNSVDMEQLLFIFFGTLSLVAVMLYAAEYLMTRFEPYLFPRKFILQSALMNISRRLGSISSFRELKELFLVDIVKTLQVTGGAIVFQYNGETEIIHEGDLDAEEINRLLVSQSLTASPGYTCLEMNNHEDYTSYLIMSRKKTNMRLGKEELRWLGLIANYLEISLENLHLINKLKGRLKELAARLPDESSAKDIQWFRKIMFDLQEEERIRIAADLHDTTMQDLFFLKRRLLQLGEKLERSPENQEQLSNTVNFVDMINASLRQSCFDLNPYLLSEIGLVQTVRTYLDKEAYTVPFALTFNAEQVQLIETKDLQVQRHIFRIVQELLNNAKKHSEASNVRFRLAESDSLFQLSYQDDGVGFLHADLAQRQIGQSSGVGMEQIRSRVQHLGGQLHIVSTKGSGVNIKITLQNEKEIPA